MHVLPQLRKLESKYADAMTVIGVHSAKFNAEKASENVREAVRRYEIGHPVVNDADFEIWKSYAARAWPTLMFIDPTGKVIGKHEGEFKPDGLDLVINEMLEEHEASLKRGEFEVSSELVESSTLSYPGKIAVDSENELLAISDSNHRRVLITDLEGNIRHEIGNGASPLVESEQPGVFANRGFDDPVFDNPQGLVLEDSTLFVADAGTHTVVEVDLTEGTARTIAGTGEQSLFRHSGGAGTKVPLNSPYDLTKTGQTLYIAMAGFHQLWSMHLDQATVSPYAGTGVENILDETTDKAQLAQPYGVEVSNNALFFIDSETSSLRVCALVEQGRVVTLVGKGLFDFGDYDGVGKDAQFQHPQGLVVQNDVIYVADSYNNKIKTVTIGSLQVTTLAGSGQVGDMDGARSIAQFSEPAGLAVHGDSLYVADTNNHKIREVDIESGDVTTLEIS